LKRQKLDHLDFDEGKESKYFFSKEATRHRPAQIVPSTSTSSHHSLATAETIVIEDDAPAPKDDDPHEPVVLATSSPDPMDIITPGVSSYAFDQSRPSPLNKFSSFLGERQKLPQGGDGASTSRVRKAMQGKGRIVESASCTDGDGDDVQPGGPLPSTSGLTARAGMSSGGSIVAEKVALYEQKLPPHLDLQKIIKQPKKSTMKPRQVGLFCPNPVTPVAEGAISTVTSIHCPFIDWTQTPLGHLASPPVPSPRRGKRSEIVFLFIYL
jgi:hypothetical protein